MSVLIAIAFGRLTVVYLLTMSIRLSDKVIILFLTSLSFTSKPSVNDVAISLPTSSKLLTSFCLKASSTAFDTLANTG